MPARSRSAARVQGKAAGGTGYGADAPSSPFVPSAYPVRSQLCLHLQCVRVLQGWTNGAPPPQVVASARNSPAQGRLPSAPPWSPQAEVRECCGLQRMP